MLDALVLVGDNPDPLLGIGHHLDFTPLPRPPFPSHRSLGRGGGTRLRAHPFHAARFPSGAYPNPVLL